MIATARRDTANSWGEVTPMKVGGKHEANSQCTPQFLEQYYHSRDLNVFWKLYGGGYFHRDDIDKVFIDENVFQRINIWFRSLARLVKEFLALKHHSIPSTFSVLVIILPLGSGESFID